MTDERDDPDESPEPDSLGKILVATLGAIGTLVGVVQTEVARLEKVLIEKGLVTREEIEASLTDEELDGQAESLGSQVQELRNSLMEQLRRIERGEDV